MALTSTRFDGTTINTIQQTVTFDTKKSGSDVIVTVKIYAGSPNGNPVQSRDFDLSANRPEESVDMYAATPVLKGTLKLAGNIVTFHGRLVTANVVNTGLQPGIVAVL